MTNPIRCRSVAVPLPLRSIERSNDRTTPPPPPRGSMEVVVVVGMAHWISGWQSLAHWHGMAPSKARCPHRGRHCCSIARRSGPTCSRSRIPNMDGWKTDGRRMEDAWKTDGHRQLLHDACNRGMEDAWRTDGHRQLLSPLPLNSRRYIQTE